MQHHSASSYWFMFLLIFLVVGCQPMIQAESITNEPAQGRPLSITATQQLLDRLPPLTMPITTVQTFHLPPQIEPPPLTGITLYETFPVTKSVVAPETIKGGPLVVLRAAPQGEINNTPFVNLTFDQPMVALTTIEQLNADTVPVTITPTLPGVWKWIGTKALNFEYKSADLTFERFPKATIYTVEVPAGTTSAVGGVLAETYSFTFTTSPPQIETAYPTGGPHSTTPVLFVRFDQAIPPDAALKTISVSAAGKVYPVRLATPDEIAADKRVQALIDESNPDHWLAFRTNEPFPHTAMIEVGIGPGTPSAEGPLTTKVAQSFRFTTHAPLQITAVDCLYNNPECSANSLFYIGFNNPLDENKFDPTLIKVEPKIPDLRILPSGSSLLIDGIKQNRTTYTVTFSAELQDSFGQKLGKDETRIFNIGPEMQMLQGPGDRFMTLEPTTGKPVVTIYSTNIDYVRLRLYQVTPDDWLAYQQWIGEHLYGKKSVAPPGKEVVSRTLRISSPLDSQVETLIDLSQALVNGLGHVILYVDAPQNKLTTPDGNQRYYHDATWIQVTRIGLDAFSDNDKMLVWATSLTDGTPLAGVEVWQYNSVSGTHTNVDGIGLFDLPKSTDQLLVALLGEDMAILPGNGGWSADDTLDDWLNWYVIDDRTLYQPSETVTVKGWLRQNGRYATSDVTLLHEPVKRVQYIVTDAKNEQLVRGEADVNDLGGFALRFTLPDSANLGYANLKIYTQTIPSIYGTETNHRFLIQEFRRPEFEVTARSETSAPSFVGDEAMLALSAHYFAGGPVPNAEASWLIKTQPASYAPPGWSDFTFGQWTPWWFGNRMNIDNQATIYPGKTDATGTHALPLRLDTVTNALPYNLIAEATVMDVNRQAWSANTNLLVHPASRYVGLRSSRYFVQQGEALEVETIVTDLDGNTLAGVTTTVSAARLEWQYALGEWKSITVDEQICMSQSAQEPVTCVFKPMIGGTYQISATVEDEQGRINSSQFQRWVSGGQPLRTYVLEQEQITLIPNKESYQPGDVAEILIQSPFVNSTGAAEGLAIISRGEMITNERFSVENGSYTFKVPIRDEHIPGLSVQLVLNGSTVRTDNTGKALPNAPTQPAFATGSINLPILPISRKLHLTLLPAALALAPGIETSLDITVTNALSQPVENAELAVMIVDEAILSLTGYQLADPLEVFYHSYGTYLYGVHSRSSVSLAAPGVLEREMMLAMVVGGVCGGCAPPATPAEPLPTIPMRTNFNPLAYFISAARTDARGHIHLTYKLPDNLTRYRVMVVAVAEGKFFGSASTQLTVRLPLMIRPSAPRFLNFGDQFELPVTIQNETDQAMEVSVGVRASNLVNSGPVGSGPVGSATVISGQTVIVPANDRVEVRFPFIANQAGTARIQVAVSSGMYSDAAELSLPVYLPATSQAFALYGVLDAGAVSQPVIRPDTVFPHYGGLEINTSSSALQNLTDAVLYLVSYRFEGSEQVASRILGVAALRDVLTTFKAEGLPTADQIDQAIVIDVRRLETLQNADGGWPAWVQGTESVPYNSIYVAHALQLATLKGYDITPKTLVRARDYLRSIARTYPSWYSDSTRHTLSAYALYVRKLMGDTDMPKARTLLKQYPLDEQSLEAIAWLWQVLSDDATSSAELEAIHQHINNRAVETSGAANFTTSYGDQGYLLLHSNRRTDGIILAALINEQPESDLIPKLVNGLLAHRTAGRWTNTQENAFILLALDRYFNTFETQTPDFVARIWLGKTYAGEHLYTGRTTERNETVIPMTYLVGKQQSPVSDHQSLTISKQGTGRLYYRLGLRYAPTDLDLDALEMGFVVQRSYEAVDDPRDVHLNEKGVWHIKAGARVRVRVGMVTNSRRYHVALVDPLPAGMEIVNSALTTVASIPQEINTVQSDWWGSWFEHQDLRDDRAEAFATLVRAGVYDYSYVVRATTPGVFIVPPARVEELYSPEVFGRSASDRVIVE